MATKGLFPLDTDLVRGPQARYHLVTIPEKPLLGSGLPPNIKELVSQTAVSLRLSNLSSIAGHTSKVGTEIANLKDAAMIAVFTESAWWNWRNQ